MALLHHLASLHEIAELDEPHLAVVVVALERLADAPAALRSLEEKKRERDWQTVNLRQVRLASTLAGLLRRASRGMGSVAQRVESMAAARDEVEAVGHEMQLHWVPAVQSIGLTAVQIAQGETHGQMAQGRAMERLNAAHADICELLDGALATARMPHRAPTPSWMCAASMPPRPHTTPKGWDEDRLLGAMERGLLSLRDQNRSLHRRLLRLQSVANLLEDFPKGESNQNQGLTSIDPEFKVISVQMLASIRQLLDPLPTPNFVYANQQELLNQLANPLDLNHERFTDIMVVRSLRDLDEVSAASRLHVPENEVLAWNPTLRLQAVILSEATATNQKVLEGVAQKGWTVYGLNALNSAQQLDAQIVALGKVLPRLLDPEVVGFLGEVYAPQVIDDIEQHAKDIMKMITGGYLLSAEAAQLVHDVEEAVRLAKKGDFELRGHLKTVTTTLGLTRSSEVLLTEY